MGLFFKALHTPHDTRRENLQTTKDELNLNSQNHEETKEKAFTLNGTPAILTRKQVAKLLQIGQSTLDTCVLASELPKLKFGKTVRYLRSDVERYVMTKRIGGEHGGPSVHID
jgi:excisionase family DNA binding protein